MSRAREVSKIVLTSSNNLTTASAAIMSDVSASISAIDYEKNIHYGTSAPASPVSGQLWVDTTNAATHLLKAYNGNTWIDVGSTAEGGFNSFFGAFK